MVGMTPRHDGTLTKWNFIGLVTERVCQIIGVVMVRSNQMRCRSKVGGCKWEQVPYLYLLCYIRRDERTHHTREGEEDLNGNISK